MMAFLLLSLLSFLPSLPPLRERTAVVAAVADVKILADGGRGVVDGYAVADKLRVRHDSVLLLIDDFVGRARQPVGQVCGWMSEAGDGSGSD